jgi:hypothetical protein
MCDWQVVEATGCKVDRCGAHCVFNSSYEENAFALPFQHARLPSSRKTKFVFARRCEIRLRAERKAGEQISKTKMDKLKGRL